MLKWICVIVVVWVVHTKAESLFQSQSTRFSLLPTKKPMGFCYQHFMHSHIQSLFFLHLGNWNWLLHHYYSQSVPFSLRMTVINLKWTESREFSLVLPGGNQDQPTFAKKPGQQTLWGENFDVLCTSNDVCMRSAMSILYTCVYIAQANKFQATRQCNVWTLTTHLGLVG